MVETVNSCPHEPMNEEKLRNDMNSFIRRLPSSRGTKRRIWAVTATGILLAIFAALYLGTQTDMLSQWQSRDTIVQLRELPLGQVKIRGVVSYVDSVNNRFWLQDETGAIVINLDPKLVDAHFGDLLVVQMRKAYTYDPTVGISSLGLTDFKVERKQRNAPLPSPAKGDLQTLSEEAKTGIRVKVEGVVHSVSAKGSGLLQVYIGDKGREIQAIVPGDPLRFAQQPNTRVRITGVLEVLLDIGGSPASELVWVQSASDLQTISSAPTLTSVSTIRSIYANSKQISADMVRVRGNVLYQETADSLILEDEWGALACQFQKPVQFAPGTAIEVRGFLKRDGLRIDLIHATPTTIATDEPSRPKNPITTISAVKVLPESAVRTAPPVRVTGVITYMDSVYRQFFLQDSTGGIFLKYAGTPLQLEVGEKITVIGMASEGDFAPVIVAPKFVAVGRAPMPKPVPLTMRAEFGVLDSLYGEVEGVVHPAREIQMPNHSTFFLYTALGPVYIDFNQNEIQKNLIATLQDATVRVRGVVGEMFNSRRQLIGVQMSIASAKDIEVI